MNDRELLQQALDSLEWAERRYSHANLDLFNKPIEAIRTKLAQPEKEWVGLTGREIVDLFSDSETELEFARAIEAKLKEKNSTETLTMLVIRLKEPVSMADEWKMECLRMLEDIKHLQTQLDILK